MNKDLIINIIVPIIAAILTSVTTVTAAGYLYVAKDVSYSNTTSGVTSSNVQGTIDDLYAAAVEYSTMDTRVSQLETDANIKITDYTYASKAVSTSGTGLSYTLPAGCDFKNVYSVNLLRAWPLSNWTNGAIVTLTNVTENQFSVTTNNAQNYYIVVRIACKYR